MKDADQLKSYAEQGIRPHSAIHHEGKLYRLLYMGRKLYGYCATEEGGDVVEDFGELTADPYRFDVLDLFLPVLLERIKAALQRVRRTTIAEA